MRTIGKTLVLAMAVTGLAVLSAAQLLRFEKFVHPENRSLDGVPRGAWLT
jgi:hypothetical protein